MHELNILVLLHHLAREWIRIRVHLYVTFAHPYVTFNKVRSHMRQVSPLAVPPGICSLTKNSGTVAAFASGNNRVVRYSVVRVQVVDLRIHPWIAAPPPPVVELLHKLVVVQQVRIRALRSVLQLAQERFVFRIEDLRSVQICWVSHRI